MAMTIGDIEKKVRTLVNDSDAPDYRFKPEEIHGFIVDALRHLWRIRPETRYVNGVLCNVEIEATASWEIPVDGRFEEALVSYAAYKVYQLDMSDTVNMQMADTLRTRAEALMQI